MATSREDLEEKSDEVHSGFVDNDISSSKSAKKLTKHQVKKVSLCV